MVTKRLTKETATGGEIRMTTEELVKQICKEQGMSVAKLAAALGQSRQNFYKKLQRDTLTAQEWQEAAKVLGVEFDQGFGERFKFCVNRKTDIKYVISYR